MLKKGGAREEVCSVAGEEGPELVAAPEEIWPGLTDPRPSPARKLPRSATTVQARAALRRSAAKGGRARLWTRGSAIRHAASYPTRMRKSSPRATRSFCSSGPPTTEKLYSLPAAHFPGVTIGYPVWHALGSGSERHEVGLGMPRRKKKGRHKAAPGCAWQPATARTSC